MRKKRQPKWDWAPHWAKMLELYKSGESIPSIHKAIQQENFRPSQRAVFYKFQQAGLATDHGRGSRPQFTGFQTQTSPVDKPSLDEILIKMSEETVPIESNTETPAPILLGEQSLVTAPREPAQDRMDDTQLALRLREQAVSGDSQVNMSLEAPRYKETISINESKFVNGEVAKHCPTSPPLNNPLRSKKSGLRKEAGGREKPLLSPEDHNELLIKNLQDVGIIDKPKERHEHTGGRTKHSHQARESDFETFLKRSNQSASPTHARPIKKLCSLFKRTSLVADNDSGYCTLASSSTRSSGRDSLMPSRSARPSLMLNFESLTDFQGLYRVECRTCQEYGIPSLYREMQPCSHCGFSKIHNLAASASRLMLRDFQDEIRLMSSSDLQALDAARNTALFYAAASGASSAHLKALIHAGISPYHRNTANQSFLHSMRPSKTRSQSCSLDCFEMGLCEMLRLFDPKMVFDQQDNNGQTVLQTLASYITEPACREDVFRFCKESGFSLHVLNRFGQSAKDIRSSDYKYPQTLTAASTFKTPGTTTPDLDNSTSEWERSRCKQEMAYTTIAEARNDTNYVHRMTKDGALHALSRVNVEDEEAIAQKINIMDHLKYFVSKGVNLNHHNRDGDHPLSAFICNQDQRREDQGIEAGPTTAKFLEVLLWKTSKRGTLSDLNNINVDMMNRRGATALYEAATRAQPESVRSLIEAGANVNARLNDDPKEPSVLKATLLERDLAKQYGDRLREHELKKVISHLGHAKASLEPTSIQQRGGGWNT